MATKPKTHSGAKKRFSKTGTGKFKYRQKGLRHILSNKNRKSKRNKKGNSILSPAAQKMVSRMLNN